MMRTTSRSRSHPSTSRRYVSTTTSLRSPFVSSRGCGPRSSNASDALWSSRLAAPFFRDFEAELAGEPPTEEQLQTLAGDVTRAVIEDMMPQIKAAAERRHAAAAAEFQRRVGAAALVEPPEAPDDDDA